MIVLITGSSGLIGVPLAAAFAELGHAVSKLDLRAARPSERVDVLDLDRVREAVSGVDGVVHLAAVSRVVWGERDPERCMLVNVGGVDNVLRSAVESRRRPWVMTVSSREVYGEPRGLPVREDDPVAPINVYGRSKLVGEQRTLAAREAGLATAVVRLSNVYGSVHDHADRVVPAFARGAVEGRDLRVDGGEHTFDFTHVRDTVRGLVATAEALRQGERSLPPVHLRTGRGTTLGQLAALALSCAKSGAKVVEGPTRRYDVARFYGDPARAEALLGWRSRLSIEEGLLDLTRQFREHLAAATVDGLG